MKRGPDRPPQGYNIIFICVDQEHYFDKWPFPVPGREHLKKNGISFLNHQVASEVCSPSRSNIYTGQHIQHTKVFDNMEAPWQRSMSPNIATIGHRLQQLGYHAAYQGKWHPSANLDAAHTPAQASLEANQKIIKSYGFNDFLGVGDLIDGPLGGYSYDGFSTASAISWLRTTARDLSDSRRPWFIAVNMVNPHDVMFLNSDAPGEPVQADGRLAFPIARPPPNEIYLAEWDAALPKTRHQVFDSPGRPPAHHEYQKAQNVLVGRWPDEDARWSLLQNYYFNCIRDCDQHVVRILDELRLNKLESSTIIVFTSDHGELGGAHQMRGKGPTVYREQNHVPLIILHPAYPGGTETKALSSHVDLAPTLLALTGKRREDIARVSTGLVGRDLTPVMSAPATAPLNAVRSAALFNFNMLTYLDAAWLGRLTQISTSKEPRVEKLVRVVMLEPDWRKRGAIRSVFDGRYKFSRYFSPLGFNNPDSVEDLFRDNDVELYDLQKDPEEVNNLAATPSHSTELVRAMSAALNATIASEVGPDTGNFLPIWDNLWLPTGAL